MRIASSNAILHLALALWAIAGVACTSQRPFHPVSPAAHRAKTQGLQAEIVEVWWGGFHAVLQVHGVEGTRLVRGLLAPVASRPCAEGLRDQGLFVDGKAQWLRPVPTAGEHRVVLTFPARGAAGLLEQSPVIDLVLVGQDDKTESCLRLPLSSGSSELAWERPVHWSADLGARGTFTSHPLGSVDSGWSIDLGVGRFVGPLRIRVELGAGLADCNGYCPPEPSGGHGFWLFPARLAVDGYLYETSGFGLAAEVSYRQLFASRPNPDNSTRWESSGGPTAALRFDLTQGSPAGWPGGGRQSALGLEISAGQWIRSDGSDAAFVWGIGLVNFVGF